MVPFDFEQWPLLVLSRPSGGTDVGYRHIVNWLVIAWSNHMNMRATDYYVFTSRGEKHPERWNWEIRRKSKPLGIKLTGNGYQSESAAQFAGRRALTELLAGLAKEERRRS